MFINKNVWIYDTFPPSHVHMHTWILEEKYYASVKQVSTYVYTHIICNHLDGYICI